MCTRIQHYSFINPCWLCKERRDTFCKQSIFMSWGLCVCDKHSLLVQWITPCLSTLVLLLKAWHMILVSPKLYRGARYLQTLNSVCMGSNNLLVEMGYQCWKFWHPLDEVCMLWHQHNLITNYWVHKWHHDSCDRLAFASWCGYANVRGISTQICTFLHIVTGSKLVYSMSPSW